MLPTADQNIAEQLTWIRYQLDRLAERRRFAPLSSDETSTYRRLADVEQSILSALRAA